jgi:hypothetical protein
VLLRERPSHKNESLTPIRFYEGNLLINENSLIAFLPIIKSKSVSITEHSIGIISFL